MAAKGLPYPKGSKWGLKKDPAVKRWLLRVSQRRGSSESTEAMYLKWLEEFKEFAGKSPRALVKEAGTKRGRERVHDSIIEFKESLRGRLSDNSVRFAVAALKSFFKHNGVVFGSLIIPSARAETAARPLKVEEVDKLLSVCNVRERALVSLLAYGGMRVGAIQYLQMKHLEDLDKIPCQVQSYDEKKNQSYVTFINERAIEALRNYFRAREMGTEKIPPEAFGPETPVIATYAGKGNVNAMTDKVVAGRVRRLFKRAGIKGKRVKPHSLRKFFDVRLIAGGCPESWANAMSGRIPEKGAGAAYNLPGPEELRAKYAEASKWFLSSESLEAQIQVLRDNGFVKATEIESLRRQTEQQQKTIHKLSVKLDAITEIMRNQAIYGRDDKMKLKIAREMQKTEPVDES